VVIRCEIPFRRPPDALTGGESTPEYAAMTPTTGLDRENLHMWEEGSAPVANR
jgi:hypothetical protein